MAGTENEIERLIEAWFKRKLDRAWRQFEAGSAVERVVSGIEDTDERRAQVRQIAIISASVTSCAAIVALIDQPTTRRENQSMTAAT